MELTKSRTFFICFVYVFLSAYGDCAAKHIATHKDEDVVVKLQSAEHIANGEYMLSYGQQ